MNFYKSFQRIPLFIMFVTIFLGCTASKKEVPLEKGVLQKIYVAGAETKHVIKKTEVLEINVRGNLPTPAYTFDHFDIQVKGNVIEITPLAKYDSNKIVTQVLVPFEKVCKVRNLKPGTYEIKVNGRSEAIKAKQKVQVQQ